MGAEKGSGLAAPTVDASKLNFPQACGKLKRRQDASGGG